MLSPLPATIDPHANTSIDNCNILQCMEFWANWEEEQLRHYDFVDYSSAFDAIIPTKLITKLQAWICKSTCASLRGYRNSPNMHTQCCGQHGSTCISSGSWSGLKWPRTLLSSFTVAPLRTFFWLHRSQLWQLCHWQLRRPTESGAFSWAHHRQETAFSAGHLPEMVPGVS